MIHVMFLQALRKTPIFAPVNSFGDWCFFMPGKLMDKIYLSQKGHIFAAKRKLYDGKYPMNVEWMNFLFQLLGAKFTIIY